jgi:hypothetical protein
MKANWKAALLLVPALTVNARTEEPRRSADLCSLFTTAEIKEFLGASVAAGRMAGPAGTACQWSGAGEGVAAYAQIQVIKGTEYWTAPSTAKGYEAVSGIGKEAFVVPEAGGWAAGALTDAAVLGAALSGGKASKESAVRLLRALLERAK